MDSPNVLLLSFLWGTLVALFAVPSIINVAHMKGLLDSPNHRTIHKDLTPRLGGLAIFAGFLSSLTIFGEFAGSSRKSGVQEMIAGALIIFFMGIKDDIISVSALKKFFVQVLAAGIMLIIADLRVTSLHGFLGIYGMNLGLSYVVTFTIIIGITNAVNLIDGIDGLAGSVVLFASVVFGVYFYYLDSPYMYVCAALAGSVAGFLRYNFYRAKVFMGDSGSLVCGFILSVMAITLVESRIISGSPPLIAIGILFIPIFDTLRVFAIRIFNGTWPFHPDRNHLHHSMLDLGISQPMIIFILISFNVAILTFCIRFSYLGFQNALIVLVALSLIISICIYLLLLRFGKPKGQDKNGIDDSVTEEQLSK